MSKELMANLITRLQKRQRENSSQGLRFVLANESDLQRIQKFYVLPENYFVFLKYHSPQDVFVEGEDFRHGLVLYGAHELIESQVGYAVDSDGNRLSDWPKNYLVIGDDGGDPFCIDLLGGTNPPVYKSDHEMSKWEFGLCSDTFTGFLSELAEADPDDNRYFTLILTGVGNNKLGLIKEVRAMTGLSPSEAKALVESVPTLLKINIRKKEAQELIARLESVGAQVKVKKTHFKIEPSDQI